MATNTFVELNKTVASGSMTTLTWSSIPDTYTDLFIVGSCKAVSPGGATFLRFNGVSTGSYGRVRILSNGSSNSSVAVANETKIVLDAPSFDWSNFTAHVQNYSNNTTHKTAIGRSNSTDYVVATVGTYRSTDKIHTISLTIDGGSYVDGSTFSLYGVLAEADSTPTTTPPVAGYSCWLDSADSSSFTYSSGTLVSQWNDKSGNGRHFTQSTTANQPNRYNNIRHNNYPVLTFNSDLMANTGFNWVNSAFTTFVVMRYLYPTFNFTGILGSNVSSGPTLGMNSDDAFATFKVGTSSSPYNLFPTNTNADVAVWKSAGVSSGNLTTTFYKNGTQASSTTSMTGLSTGTGAVLGASTATGTDINPASNSLFICEVIVYPSQLSDTDRNSVEAYLKTKWGTP